MNKKQIIRSHENDRNIYLLRNESDEIIEMNFIQGYDDLKLLDEVNDKELLEMYNKLKDYSLFDSMSEEEKINEIMWLHITLELDIYLDNK